MNCLTVPIGTPIAPILPEGSRSDRKNPPPVETTGDVIKLLHRNEAPSVPMMRSACVAFGMYLNQPADQLLLEDVYAARKGFRSFLVSRNYAENSIRTYIDHLTALIRAAERYGWNRDAKLSSAWMSLLPEAKQLGLKDMVRHFARITHMPAELTIADVDEWGLTRIKEGMVFANVASKKNEFWRLLLRNNLTSIKPRSVWVHERYAIPLNDLSPELREDIKTILKWKQARFAINRPKRGQIRATSAKNLQQHLTQLAGVAINVLDLQTARLTDLLQRDIVEAFTDWAINERGMSPHSVFIKLATITGILQHSSLCDRDFSWIKKIMDGIPVENDSERKLRKASKILPYEAPRSYPGEDSGRARSLRTEEERGPETCRHVDGSGTHLRVVPDPAVAPT